MALDTSTWTPEQITAYNKAAGMAATPVAPIAMTQAQLDAQNTSLGRTQYNTGSVTSAGLASNPITLPQPSPDTTNYAGMTANGFATIGANNNTLMPPSSSDTSYKSLLEMLNTSPPSASDQYQADYNASGIAGLQSDYNTKNQTLLDSQGKLSAVNAKIEGLNAEAKAAKLSAEQAGNAPRFVVGADQMQIDRQFAIKALPLQAEALSAQAEVAAAQGNATLSQSILQQAQDHLDKLFQIHQQDATNKYNQKIKNIEAVYNYADKQEQHQLDAQKATLAQNQQNYTNLVADIRTAATSATANGQGQLSTKLANLISTLNPNSKTFAQDYQTVQQTFATLQGQIAPKATAEQRSQTEIALMNKRLTNAKGADGYTDPNLYTRLRSSSTLSANDFDNRFGYLVNPLSAARLGITKSVSSTGLGTYTTTQQQMLIGTGIPATKIGVIEQYINQYGLQAALDNSDLTSTQKTALKAVYGQ